MYELHKLIDKIKYDRAVYEDKYKEGDELLDVKESLNNRIVYLREQLLEEPDNPNLNFELGFCEEEVERIAKEQKEFNEKFESKEAQIEKHEQIIEYDIRELYAYVGFLNDLDIDEKLLNAIRESVESLDENITILNNLKK